MSTFINISNGLRRSFGKVQNKNLNLKSLPFYCNIDYFLNNWAKHEKRKSILIKNLETLYLFNLKCWVLFENIVILKFFLRILAKDCKFYFFTHFLKLQSICHCYQFFVILPAAQDFTWANPHPKFFRSYKKNWTPPKKISEYAPEQVP